MSALKDTIKTMKKLILLSDQMNRTGDLIDKMTDELREHDRRLVRLETMVEIAKAQKLPKN